MQRRERLLATGYWLLVFGTWSLARDGVGAAQPSAVLWNSAQQP
jgi:hypothetical protein